MLLMGTAVQWNDEYAVTVKHLPYVRGSVFKGRGDVQFFRNKAVQAPQWRQYRPGEAVTAVGFNTFYIPTQAQGRALSAMVRLDAADGGVMYGTHNGPTVKGMSGGPVFAEDGHAVGISVAYLDKGRLQGLKRDDLSSQPQVSIFLPYSEINREWQRYQAQLAKTRRAPAPIGTGIAIVAAP